MKNKSLFDSFNNALSGVIRALKTEKNLKIHFIAAFIVFSLSLFYNFTTAEFLIILSTIIIVICAELFNTAIEAIVDLVCGTKRHPLAKKAKDVAAGAVFISSLNAVIVAYILFYKKFSINTTMVIHKIRQLPVYITLISILLVLLATIVIKTITGYTKILRGGMPSGHSSISFAFATCIAFLSSDMIVISLAYLLAFLVAQSRVEGKIHNIIEAIVGSLLGTLITMLIFQVFTQYPFL